MGTRFPDQFSLADYFLYDRLNEGLGDKPAMLFGERRYSYQQITDKSRALGRYLQSIGVRQEERVYIVLPDMPPFVWSIFGTWSAGAVLAMGNPSSPLDDLDYVINYTGASILITLPAVAEALAPQLLANSRLRAVLLAPDVATGDDPEQATSIPASLQGATFDVLSLSDAITHGSQLDLPAPQLHRDDMACWLFTSGSTGRPKAAMHTQRDFAFNTEVYAKGTVGYQRDDITVSVPRLFFGYATGTNLLFPFSVGATTALFSEAPRPDSLASAIEMYRPTIITNVPTMLGKLLVEKPDLNLSSVRFQLSAGEALPPTLLEKFNEHFGCDNIYDGIGSAEMFHIYCSNRPGDIKPGSLGRSVEGYQLKILPSDASGPGAEELPPGETGVLWVKGDSVALGYHKDRDKSWRTFHGHWCCTGDLFSKDKDGYLWFSGRADDLMKVNGRWMAPQEVEDCLLQHAAVAACAVIPKDVDGLTKPKALVVLMDAHKGREGDELIEELQQHVLNSIAKHKYPRLIEFVADLPKNDRGKVDRKALMERES
ncbi:benzoate-CoA ligase family protein [Porticoccus sp. W117]|uniref:benzoate-CoA ligase family protein n=1 Tax=Porticoccus sp. W117 TaxID=3054777 RepID=UPI002596CAA2|nr:benzoate-CoA ligase family protein [Porticoccus sp. W117]MDM3871898.1 benzoate-CoA ligase family protein [Porticoccus sp. W117]